MLGDVEGIDESCQLGSDCVEEMLLEAEERRDLGGSHKACLSDNRRVGHDRVDAKQLAQLSKDGLVLWDFVLFHCILECVEGVNYRMTHTQSLQFDACPLVPYVKVAPSFRFVHDAVSTQL